MVLVAPHPHDILIAKVERWETQDREHAALILAAFPLTRGQASLLLDRTPHRTGAILDADRLARFEAHTIDLLAMLPDVSEGEYR